MIQQPLLILCDSIANNTGLARIGRDTSTRIHADPSLSSIFRVATLGVGGPISTSSRFPFQNGSILRLQQMIPHDLPDFWTDHAGWYGDSRQEDSAEDLQERRGQVRKGILLTIWNLSWCQWLSQPYLLGEGHPVRSFLLPRPQSVSADHWKSISSPSSPSYSPPLLTRLANQPFQRWLYCPVDGHLPDGTLGHQLAPILQGFDRLVAYTRYGAGVIERTLEKWGGQSAIQTVNSIPNLPHGLDRTVFHPRDRALARQTFLSRISNGVSALPLLDDQILLCMVGTNSSRKLWGETFQTAAELVRRGVNIFLWGHTDCLTAPPGHWNLPALAKQLGLDRRVVLTSDHLTDDDLSWSYSAADCMIATSSEGFGYAPFEGLACGLPAIGTTYAGSAEFVPSEWQVNPVSYSLESPFLIQRSIHDPAQIADKVQLVLQSNVDHARSLLPAEYEWENLWPRWADFLRKGVE